MKIAYKSWIRIVDYGPQLTDFDVIPPALCEKFMNRESLNISQFITEYCKREF